MPPLWRHNHVNRGEIEAEAIEHDQEAIQPLMAHANRLLEYLTSSPVQSAATAAASMRILIRPECARSIKDGGPDDFHYTGFERILAWLEAAAAREGRHS